MSAAEYVALRDRFRIGALEANHGLPAWEVDMLLTFLRDEAQQRAMQEAREQQAP